MTPFAVFALLYMAAVCLELAEKWTYPLFTLVTFLLAIGILSTRVTRFTFLIFLAVTTSHFLLVQFPDVANHVNIALYCNLFMMVGIVFSLIRIRDYPTDNEYFAMIRPLLQISTILVYFLAGFSKLNRGFVDPDVSCVKMMVTNLHAVPTTVIRGIPVGLILMVGVVAVVYRLLSRRWERRMLVAVAGTLGLALMAGVVFLVLVPIPELVSTATTLAVVTMVIVVISWELIGGLLLAVPGFQLPVLAFSWSMHASLALIGFVDFGALALALLFTFIPPRYLDLMQNRVRLPILGHSMHRAHVYFALNVFCGIVSGFHQRLVAGIIFNVAALVLIWPLLSALASPLPRPAWVGVRISGQPTPRWMLVFPCVLLLYGLTSYLGLRTAGNFTMFSNLRTEGPVSNHFLLSRNPLKLWDYQEDVVSFVEINDKKARIGYQYQPLKGNQLPVVEFRKLIYQWTKAGWTVPMTFTYHGRLHSTRDIVNDPAWRTPARDWEMVLMDFRVIQTDGPNQCRW
jgi:hypothetical protein